FPIDPGNRIQCCHQRAVGETLALFRGGKTGIRSRDIIRGGWIVKYFWWCKTSISRSRVIRTGHPLSPAPEYFSGPFPARHRISSCITINQRCLLPCHSTQSLVFRFGFKEFIKLFIITV